MTQKFSSRNHTTSKVSAYQAFQRFNNPSCMQLALILGEERVTIHNITSRSFEPECLPSPPAGAHCVATPHGEALLILYPFASAAAPDAATSSDVDHSSCTSLGKFAAQGQVHIAPRKLDRAHNKCITVYSTVVKMLWEERWGACAGGQWLMDVYALEAAGDDQPMFHPLRHQQPVFQLPNTVRTVTFVV